MTKTFEEINRKIKQGDAVVLTAEQMIDYVRENGSKKAAKDIDVVTTGTFGAMCSSGAMLNFGHADPPIKMQKVWLNDVEAYTGIAAVDAYIGATQLSESEGIKYGGGHVIEDLISGKDVELRATSYGTDCYPRKKITTNLALDDLNEAYLLNPRNCYQNYAVATNSTDKTIYTYMGKLLPNFGNANYTTASQLSPLINDPYLETIGIGTRIFVGGAQGHIIGEGTQHNVKVQRKNGIPVGPGATLSVRANLRDCLTKYLAGASYTGYGTSLMVGIGVPIPILNEDIAKRTAIDDSQIYTKVLDYSLPSRSKPTLKTVNYEELRSGAIEINGKEIKTSSMGSLKKSREIANLLKKWIEKGSFTLTAPVAKFPQSECRDMKHKVSYVRDITKKTPVVGLDDTLEKVSRLAVEKGVDHLPVVENNKLAGIITTWDITRAVAKGGKELRKVMTTNVITARPEEGIQVVAERLKKHGISAMPVVDESKKVLGVVTVEEIAKLAK